MSGAPDALVDFHTGEKSARLDAAQKEILAIGKERWVEKVEETRMIRKMAGLVALGMSLLTVFYARAFLKSVMKLLSYLTTLLTQLIVLTPYVHSLKRGLNRLRMLL